MWEELSTEFKVLLISSEIVVSGLVIWGFFKFFQKFKRDEEKHQDAVRKWKDKEPDDPLDEG